ncbi:hypothetical protein BH11PSE2_BH11PSE2_21460 [soil metagenome]
MSLFNTASLGLALAALTAVAALAETPPATGGMMKPAGAMAKPMAVSTADMKAMDKCKAMASDAMMKNKTCKAMMKKHPDMMKMDGMAKPGMKTDAMPATTTSMMKK